MTTITINIPIELVAKELTKELLDDMSGRGGYDLYACDDDVIEEWKEKWKQIIQDKLSAYALYNEGG